jgi:hypothetical protein
MCVVPILCVSWTDYILLRSHVSVVARRVTSDCTVTFRLISGGWWSSLETLLLVSYISVAAGDFMRTSGGW